MTNTPSSPPPGPEPTPTRNSWGVGRIVALVVGVLIILPAIGLVLSGGALLLAYLVGREDGYFTGDVGGVETATAAITTEEIDLNLDPGTPGWLVDAIESDVRLRVTDQTGGDDGLFVGIGPADAVDGYLAGVAHEEITDVTASTRAAPNRRPAPARRPAPPLRAPPPPPKRLLSPSVSGADPGLIRRAPPTAHPHLPRRVSVA